MRTPAWIAALALAAALVAAWLGHRAEGRAQAAFAASEIRRHALAGELRSWQDRSAAKKGPPPGRKSPAATAVKEAALQANDPTVRAAYLKFFGARLHSQRRFLYHDLSLTPDQVKKIEALETAHEEDRLDRAAAVQAQGLSLRDPAVEAMQKQADGQLAVAEAEILGQAGYQQLQQADRGKGAESLGDDVSRLLSYGGNPLTLDQGEQLMNSVLASSASYQTGGIPNPETLDRGTLLAQARNFLTPIQVTALQSDTELGPVVTLVKQFYQSAAASKGR